MRSMGPHAACVAGGLLLLLAGLAPAQQPFGGFYPTRVLHHVGHFPAAVEGADLDGDGRLDLVVVSSRPEQDAGQATFDGNVFILRGDGAGGFSVLRSENLDQLVSGTAGDNRSAVDLALGWFHGAAQHLDVAILSEGKRDAEGLPLFPDKVTILHPETATGLLSQVFEFDLGVGTVPRDLAVSDFAAGGQDDLAVAHSHDPTDTTTTDKISLIILEASANPNLPAIRFETLATASGLDNPSSLAFADLVGQGNSLPDGVLDLIATYEGGLIAGDAPIEQTGSVALWVGTGGGGFQLHPSAHNPYPMRDKRPQTLGRPQFPIRPVSLDLADLNGDAKLDVVVGTQNGAQSTFVHILINDFQSSGDFKDVSGDGSDFSHDVRGQTNAPAVRAVDLNGDAKPDIVGVTRFDNVGWFALYKENDASGFPVFDRFTTFPAGASPADFVIAELDGDPDLEIAVVNSGTDSDRCSFPRRPPLKTMNLTLLDTAPEATDGLELSFTDFVESLPATHPLKTYLTTSDGGAVVADFNNDDYPDLYLVNGLLPDATGMVTPANVVLMNTKGTTGTLDFQELCAFYTDANGNCLLPPDDAAHGRALQQHSVGAAAADFDNDGDLDLYVTGSLDFTPGSPCSNDRALASPADADKARNILYLNRFLENGQAFVSFEDVTAATGVDGVLIETVGPDLILKRGHSLSMTVGDFNLDGWLDIYVGDFYGNGRDPFRATARCNFVADDHKDNSKFGMRNTLFLSSGVDASGNLKPFTDKTVSAGVEGTVSSMPAVYAGHDPATENPPVLSDGSSALGAVPTDVQNDRWPDLVVPNDMDCPDASQLYVNDGLNSLLGVWKGTFTEQSEQAGILKPDLAHPVAAGMGTDTVDVDGDGDLDLVVSDTNDPQGENVGNTLLINRYVETGQVSFDVVNFPNRIGGNFGWGMGWEDLDNDGDFDLHFASRPYLWDALYRHDGLDASGLPIYVNVAGMAGVNRFRNSRGTAYADFDRDGLIDIVVNSGIDPRIQRDDDFGPTRTRSLSLYLNKLKKTDPAVPLHHFVQIKLLGKPPTPCATPFLCPIGHQHSTKDAIGARIVVEADLDGDGVVEPAEKMMRIVTAGESSAGSTSDRIQHFGLRKADAVAPNPSVTVTVFWPSGQVTTRALGPADIDQTIPYLIAEP